MSFFVFQELQLGELKPTFTSLHLAFGSVKHPKVVVESVHVKVDRYHFPTNFIVLDMKVDQEMPFILVQPFLAMCKTKFDVKEGLLILSIGKKENLL